MLTGIFVIALSGMGIPPSQTDQLLDQAQAAMRRGDYATSRRLLDQANLRINAATERLRHRFTLHDDWEACVRRETQRVAQLTGDIGPLADAAMGRCQTEELAVFSAASETMDDYPEQDRPELLQTWVTRWRTELREHALATLANIRLAAQSQNGN